MEGLVVAALALIAAGLMYELGLLPAALSYRRLLNTDLAGRLDVTPPSSHSHPPMLPTAAGASCSSKAAVKTYDPRSETMCSLY